MTRTSRNSAFALGMSLTDIVALIQGTSRGHFYKSMTTFADSRTWQDVYRVPWDGLLIYLKFSRDADGHVVMSLKEK